MTSPKAEEQPKDEESELLHSPPRPPVTVAGGFQGFEPFDRPEKVQQQQPQQQQQQQEHDFDERTEPDERQKRFSALGRFRSCFPRLYHVVMQILLPILVLIILAFIFGYILALTESGNERDANDALIANTANKYSNINLLANLTQTSPTLCLEKYEGSFENQTALKEHMKTCGDEQADEVRGMLQEFTEDLISEAYSSMTYDWTICKDAEGRQEHQQFEHILTSWIESYESLKQKYEQEGREGAEYFAWHEASGYEGCSVNSAGGAAFWFTVMTTIGYGNATTVTFWGRFLVYTLGFVSILIFTALIGQAGYVCLVIVDDFFCRIKWKKMTRGIPAVVFWLCIFILWLLVIAAIAVVITRARYGFADFSLGDAMWFSYISSTTVGLGDYHIRHNTFQPVDMFYLPLIFLISFVFLANYLLKLSALLTSRSSSKSEQPSLESILKESRKKMSKLEDEKKERPVDVSSVDSTDHS